MTAHPFELSGLGIGPFRCVGVASIPSPTLAEQNPDAFQNALRALPQGWGLGTCQHCGTAIVHNFMIVSRDGKKFVVGSDCVAKTGDQSLGLAVKVLAARAERDARREKAAARREAAHQRWLAKADPKTGETNAARLERENAERRAQHEAWMAAQAAQARKFEFLLPILDGQNGGFCRSIAQGIREGATPSHGAIRVLREIFAKAHGRRGSAANEAAANKFDELIGDQA